MSSSVKPVGLGFGLLGTTNTAPIPDAQAERMMAAAWELGIRRFDTAPLYGGGLSEERLGRLLRGLPRDEYALSTKVGRYRDYAAAVTNPKDNPGDWRDYSRDATLRSVEASLERLGVDRLDIAFVHDCDTHIGAALKGALPALAELKSQGLVGAIGCGSNVAATHLALLRAAEPDVLMVAGRFTLLDQSAADELFPLCLSRGVEVELAAPFNSGILATGPDDATTRFDYQAPDEATRARVRAIQSVCAAQGIPLKRAALHYSAAHPAVTRLVLGLTDPAGLQSNLADLAAPLPATLWPALAELGIPAPTGES
ncbi:aldo/keto reductase [Vannielia litorea]|uniref:D-threo-aldose 1-dehydrogenase n=1 Tax=Vannielia litorea TaxID=1217970 RepID=A0A1N6EKS9_9RHOB|nr:aldo/keto reductase [Vannielia litorea]SIN83689.1 D-threo-aldose 1-dehydrogenase [Vannielia litorea]